MNMNPIVSSDLVKSTLSNFATLLCSASTPDGNPMDSTLSYLNDFAATESLGAERIFSFPSLLLHATKRRAPNITKALDSVAASNLASSFSCNSFELLNAPTTLLNNLKSSFESLIDSRIRSIVLAILKQATKNESGPEYFSKVAHNQILVQILCSNPITITTVVTSFHCLKTCAVQCDRMNIYSLPLIFEAIFDVSIMESDLVTIKVRAPGSIKADIPIADVSGAVNMNNAELSLDTELLLHSMMKEVRFIVRKLTAKATNIVLAITSRHQQDLSSIDSTSIISSHQLSDKPLEKSFPSQQYDSSKMLPPPPRKQKSKNSNIVDLDHCADEISNSSYHNFEMIPSATDEPLQTEFERFEENNSSERQPRVGSNTRLDILIQISEENRSDRSVISKESDFQSMIPKQDTQLLQ